MTSGQVVASLVGGILVLLLQWVWKTALPELALRFQKNEPRIAGRWKTTFKENGKEYHENVTLKQRGRSITGVILLKEEENAEDIVYNFTGTFKNLILSGTYVSTDEADFERGVILLRYLGKGKFIGQNIFFSKTSEKLIPSDYVWTSI